MIGAVSSSNFTYASMRNSPAAAAVTTCACGSANCNCAGTSSSKASAAQKSPEEKAVIDELAATDRKVRAHEQAHMAAAGGLALGGPTYSFQIGPDGRNYAVGGEVQIDTSPGKTPEETLRKAATIRAAALAPSEPSGQDMAVAMAAAQMAASARIEISQARQNPETQSGDTGTDYSYANNARQTYSDVAAAGNSPERFSAIA